MPRKKPGRWAYPTDLTDTQWALIAPLIPEAEPGGRPRKASSRELVDAILYFLRAGMAWRLLPHESSALADSLLLSAAMAAGGGVGSGSPHARDGRPRAGRARGEPDGCDPGQPIRQNGGSKGGSKGYDAGKKVKGRKRHILTDTDGRLLAIEVHGGRHPGPRRSQRGAEALAGSLSVRRVAYVDGGYAGRLARWAKERTHIVLEVVKRSAGQVGFAVIRRRWVMERTFAWIVKNRRFVRDYEQLTAVAETLITIAASATLIRRWA